MSDFKYLSDGRKVKVIGKINNQETIVQEIFITEQGDEVPSGERFVVRSLHDEPVLSYKEKRAIEIEKELKSLEFKSKAAWIEYQEGQAKLEGIAEMIRSSTKLVKVLEEKDLKTFAQFMTGSIKYLVFCGYRIKPPVEMIDEIIYYDGYNGKTKFDGIKLVSVLGRSDGNFEYNINRYRDGSGSSIEVRPFCTLKEALNFIKEMAEDRIEDNRLHKTCYDACIKMGITFSKKHSKLYKAYRIKQLQDIIKICEEEKDNKQREIKGYHKEVKELKEPK